MIKTCILRWFFFSSRVMPMSKGGVNYFKCLTKEKSCLKKRSIKKLLKLCTKLSIIKLLNKILTSNMLRKFLLSWFTVLKKSISRCLIKLWLMSHRNLANKLFKIKSWIFNNLKKNKWLILLVKNEICEF